MFIEGISQEVAQPTFQFEQATVAEVQATQDANLALVDQFFNDPTKVYGENPEKSGGSYLVDIFNTAHVQRVFAESKSIIGTGTLSRLANMARSIYSSHQLYNLARGIKPVFKDPQNPEYMVFSKRSNIVQYPAELEDYKGQPYYGISPNKSFDILTAGKFGGILNQETAGLVNEPAIVVAEAQLKGNTWLYVRTNTVAGWVKQDDSIVRGLTADQIEFDPLRPADTKKRIEEKGHTLGVITAYGLTLDEERPGVLRDIIDVNANAQFAYREPRSLKQFKEDLKDKNLSDKEIQREFLKYHDPEPYGDGILETGESAIFSIGDNVKIIAQNVDGSNYHKIQTADGKFYMIHASKINIGFLAQTQSNMARLVQSSNGKVYVWGGGNGIGNDCSFWTNSLFKSFGICIPRVGNPQRYGNPEKTATYARRQSESESNADYLPRTVEDLHAKGLLNKVNWGFTTMSWGNHVMLMLGAKEDGTIIYAHSVMSMKPIDEDGTAIKLARVTVGPVDNKGTYNAQGKLIQNPTNFFNPKLDLGGEQDMSFVGMVSWGVRVL